MTAENEDETPKGKGRPLAARRTLVTKTTSEEIKESSVDAVVDIKDSDGNDVDTAAVSPVTVPAATINITSTRTREIEKEIAGHNASHDKAIAQEPKEASPVLPLVKKQVRSDNLYRRPFFTYCCSCNYLDSFYAEINRLLILETSHSYACL